MPLISVIVPTYNGEKYLSQTVQSVFCQTLGSWELIIINDGSTDRSLQMARQLAAGDARVRVVDQANMGIAGARNRGLHASNPSSKYLIFLDHDDIWEPDALETLLLAAQVHQRAPGIYGLVRYIDERGGQINVEDQRPFPVGYRELRRTQLTLVDCIRFPIFTTMGRLLIARWALEATGDLDPETSPADDLDIWVRLCLQGDLVCSAHLVLSWRRHDKNTSRRTDIYRASLRVYQKFATDHSLSTKQRWAARQGYRWNQWCLAKLRWDWALDGIVQRHWWKAAKQARHSILHAFYAFLGDASHVE